MPSGAKKKLIATKKRAQPKPKNDKANQADQVEVNVVIEAANGNIEGQVHTGGGGGRCSRLIFAQIYRAS